MKRVASGYALIILFCIIIIGGITWAVLYWGGMLPLQSYIIALYSVNIFPSTPYQFMVEVGAFWGFIMTIAVLVWLWNQSNRRDSPTV